MAKTLVFMRTHIISQGVISEFLKLKNSVDFDCILFVDNNKNILTGNFDNPIQCLDFFGGHVKNIKCFLFNEKIFNSLGLPYYAKRNKNKSFAEIMWYCADYMFFAVKKYFPEYDYYWQLEYDVFCNGNSYQPFFNRYNGLNSDLIITGTDKVNANSQWYWVKKTDWIYKKVQLYGSFFPIVRLSSTAIDFLFKRRLEIAEVFSQVSANKKNRWIHCELFVPTELLNNGFSAAKLNEPLRFLPNYDLNEDRIFENPDNKIYHPVKGNYEASLDAMRNKIKKLEKFRVSIWGYRLGIFLYKK